MDKKNNKAPGTVEELLKKVDEFERTIAALSENVKIFKLKLLEKKQRFGSDLSKWPEAN